MISLILLLAACSCKKVIHTPVPSNDMDAASVYSSDAGAEAAMIGFYNQAMDNTQGILNGSISLYGGLSADELACTFPFLPEDSFYINRLTPSNVLSSNLFSSAYNLIYGLNSIIEGVSRTGQVSSAERIRLFGEAKFLRSLLYFHLIQLYGGVPLVTGTQYTVNAWLPRATADSLYGQLIADLKEAQQGLPVDYITHAGYEGDRTRPVQASATALLARIYCYRKAWALAAQAATAVIDDGRYRLEPGLDSVFLSTSREAIWQLQPVHDTMATADAKALLPFGPLRFLYFYLTPQLLGGFEPGDQRRLHWTATTAMGGKPYVYAYKYKLAGYHAGQATEYEMVLRLAEQYLIRAEARAQLGDLTGALADLNRIRQRAALPASQAGDQATILSAILAERRVELFTEWGHRWFDLKRLGQADAVLGTKPGWRSTDTLYPIPVYEVLGNPNIEQNPGY